MINNGGMGNAMETKSLLEAFRSAGDVAFDCRHYLEWEQAKNKGETTQTESLFLLLSEFDDAEIAEGGRYSLSHEQDRVQRLPSTIKAGYSRFIGFVEGNGGDVGIDNFFQNVKYALLDALDLPTEKERRLCAYSLIEPVQEFAEKYLSPYYGECYSYIRVLYAYEGTHEDYLKFLCYMARQYANVLDAVLLMKGDDLLKIQEDMDIHVLPERDVLSLSGILGGMRIATAYINALPTRQNEPQQETEQEKPYFDRAIKAGYMTETANGYEWTWGGTRGKKARLAYFITKIYDPMQSIPYKRLESLFGVSRLDSAVTQLMYAKRPPQWRKGIDLLFQEENDT